MNRKRPCPSSTEPTVPHNNQHLHTIHLCAYLLLALVLVPSAPLRVEAFGTVGINHQLSREHTIRSAFTSSSLRRDTSLCVSTLSPPPQHLEWLKSQDEQERRFKRAQQTSSTTPQKRHPVLPFTLFSPPEQHILDSHHQENHNNTHTQSLSAKEAWAASFTTVEALRDTFGRNRNPLWGDLDARTTRRLYKTLLPRALLELYHTHGASSEDLAPLAYRARVAAKKYARERCELPARIAASLFDGFRQFRKYGRFQVSGISYPQLWEKYATQIMEEEDFADEQDLTSKVCYKILEKSCETNKQVDSLFLSDEEDLQEITRKLEQDVYDLLEDEPEDHNTWAIRRYKILRTLLRIRRQMEGRSYTEKDDRAAMHAVMQDLAETPE